MVPFHFHLVRDFDVHQFAWNFDEIKVADSNYVLMLSSFDT
jgi:hypothetical protein